MGSLQSMCDALHIQLSGQLHSGIDDATTVANVLAGIIRETRTRPFIPPYARGRDGRRDGRSGGRGGKVGRGGRGERGGRGGRDRDDSKLKENLDDELIQFQAK